MRRSRFFDGNDPHTIESTLWRAAAHSGDNDSTASIMGNLLGAMLGAERLPRHWLAQLELRDVIETLATDLHRPAIGREPLSYDIYPPN